MVLALNRINIPDTGIRNCPVSKKSLHANKTIRLDSLKIDDSYVKEQFSEQFFNGFPRGN